MADNIPTTETTTIHQPITLQKAQNMARKFLSTGKYKIFKGNKYHRFRALRRRMTPDKPPSLQTVADVMTELGHQIFFH